MQVTAYWRPNILRDFTIELGTNESRQSYTICHLGYHAKASQLQKLMFSFYASLIRLLYETLILVPTKIYCRVRFVAERPRISCSFVLECTLFMERAFAKLPKHAPERNSKAQTTECCVI
jgi:hypothetical protein